MKIAVIYKKDEQTNIIVEQFKELCNFEVLNLANSDNYDLIISFGGDGTTLKAMPFALSSNKPLISVNTGNLGFLSSYSQLSLSLFHSFLKTYKLLLFEHLIQHFLLLAFVY